MITEGKKAFLRPVTRNVDDVFGRLHKPGMKSVSIDKMDAGIRQSEEKSYLFYRLRNKDFSFRSK